MKANKSTKTKATNTRQTAAKAVPSAGVKTAPVGRRNAQAEAVAAVAAGRPGTAARAAHEITADQIAARAYAIWERHGRAHGRHVANWLQAERELRAEIKTLAE
jgi:hypothetical protein